MSEQQWGINTVLKQTQTPWLNPPFPRNQQFLGETQLHPHDPPRTPQAPSTEPGSSAATVSRAPYLEDKGLTRADSCGHISRNVPVSNVPPADTKNFSSEKARGGNRVPSSKEEVETRGSREESQWSILAAQLEEQRGVIGGCPSGPGDKINWNLGKFTTRPTEKLRENAT